ncbi:MAG: putative transmembrane protein [Candidatus Ruthia sp. Asou_11_S2]|nr:putative transmembrane protein [Candidatus Ruthia sp. Asou_11_S2]
MNSKKELWILLASFVLPIAFGTTFFYLSPASFTQHTVNYGEFVNPIITTTKQDITFIDTQSSLQGLWTLTYTTKQCGNTCIKALQDMKTVRILMNEDMRRIQNLLLITNKAKAKQADVLVGHASKAFNRQLNQFPENSLFLIDPLGNVMLRYNSKNLEIKRVIKDLKRLFKYSRIG